MYYGALGYADNKVDKRKLDIHISDVINNCMHVCIYCLSNTHWIFLILNLPKAL